MTGFLDIPKFKVRPVPERFLFNKIIYTVIFGIIAYIIIYFNYMLIVSSVPNYWNWIIIIIILLFIIAFALSSYVKYSQYSYTFYDYKVVIHEQNDKVIDYNIIQSISFKQNFIDKWFDCSTINMQLDVLSGIKLVKIQYIHSGNKIFFMLQKTKNITEI
jgi:uncharacterized membrane protein YdbT with pleckstrin-like domain